MDFVSKEEVGYPMDATESVIISDVIDSHQHRYVSTADIPNAFIQTDVKQVIIITIRGKLVSLLVSLFPETYKKYVTSDKNVKIVLYLRLRKSLY